MERVQLNKKRLIDATFEDLEKFLECYFDNHPISQPNEKKFVRGLTGIMEIFGCGKTKAVELKRDVIRDAVHDYGGFFITDRQKAIEIFCNLNRKKR